MNIYDASSGETVFINSREVAPIDATENMYQGDSDQSRNGKTLYNIISLSPPPNNKDTCVF